MKQIQIGTVNVATIIRSKLSALNPAEKTLAEYILNHMEEVMYLTIEQLASKSGTSYSSVSRFCQLLGFSGFKELKKRITEDILNSSLHADRIAGRGMEKPMEQLICEESFSWFMDIITDCASLLNIDDLRHAVDLMLGSKTLYIIGTGASAASAQFAYTEFLRLNKNCAMDVDPTLIHMKVSMMGPGDVIFCISASGRTAEVVETAKEARNRGVKVISLSNFITSPLQRQSDVSLYTTSHDANSIEADVPRTNTIGQIALIDIIYSCCMERLGEIGTQNFQRTQEAADRGKLR